jgi:hypothetical protein
MCKTLGLKTKEAAPNFLKQPLLFIKASRKLGDSFGLHKFCEMVQIIKPII